VQVAWLPPIVDAATLADQLDDPSLRIFDATTHLRRQVEGGPYVVESGRSDYTAAHIPGAAFADIPGELSDPNSPFPFTLPDEQHFAAAAGRLGLGPGTHVVAYAQASPMWATRLWWLLRYFGFDDVSVLDGGLPAWHEQGLPVETGEATYPAAQFSARRRPHLVATLDDIKAAVDTASPVCLVNALPTAAFTGNGPGAYSRPGRIPRSLSLPSAHLLNRDTRPRFRPVPEMKAAFEQAGIDVSHDSQPIIAYCGGGISATVDLFALFLVGRAADRLYDGSLTEWSADPDLPLISG
jgi:thiosulfate/3-mercaptopyruvate sulfurtransferase